MKATTKDSLYMMLVFTLFILSEWIVESSSDFIVNLFM